MTPPETGASSVSGRERGFHHLTLLYSGDEGFLRGTLPFIGEALAGGEPVLVAVSGDRIELLKETLAEDASRVEFADRVFGAIS